MLPLLPRLPPQPGSLFFCPEAEPLYPIYPLYPLYPLYPIYPHRLPPFIVSPDTGSQFSIPLYF